jgi:hypothetical protein
MQHRQRGTTTIEFAIVGGLFFLALFGVAEIARAIYTWNALTEATRRGARVAAICPLNHSAISRVTVFQAGGSGAPQAFLPDLTPANVDLAYLDTDGLPIADPSGNFGLIRYVRVGIVGYQHNFIVSMFGASIDAPEFYSTLPRESLGIPRVGAGPQCFGTAV